MFQAGHSESLRGRHILVVATLVIAALGSCSRSSSGPSSDRVDQLFAEQNNPRSPGCSVAISRNGAIVYEHGYGMADLEWNVPITPTTVMGAASISKQFTAKSILLLAQQGKLLLDDDVSQYIPEWSDREHHVTIRHLLTHTSGLIDYEDIMPESPPTPAASATSSALPATSDEVVTDPSRQLRDIDVLHLLEKERRLYFEPGTQYRYSNGGYSMLALIVERASGKKFQDFLHERIFEPLGMRDTLAYVAEGPAVPHRAYGYTLANDGKWQRTDQSLTSAVLGDGGIYSSIDDLAKWDAAQYDDRLLSDASRELAFTPWTKTDDEQVKYGFGWRITGATLWHSGETIGFRNVIVRYPKAHLSVIVLTNRNDPEPYRMALAIAQLYLQ